ncbi:formyltetrahydrofolate deformylase 2, mitochondrial isoform X1 [Iris pallida]|uniref:Formyltetrahydrofolate deformylase 2, mitochondrial isoform X1 n=1 Tax=Iris pallida TaxID=29817 RepID=A0AAX6EUX9_IRIPA|nr:formyltetrahydrofolate deformylase 2, mitochondrial isoform X1 [Iris pallida]
MLAIANFQPNQNRLFRSPPTTKQKTPLMAEDQQKKRLHPNHRRRRRRQLIPRCCRYREKNDDPPQSLRFSRFPTEPRSPRLPVPGLRRHRREALRVHRLPRRKHPRCRRLRAGEQPSLLLQKRICLILHVGQGM